MKLYLSCYILILQNVTTTVQCYLDTFDVTIPSGRLEANHLKSSHPDHLSAAMIIIDDSPIRQQMAAVGVGEFYYGHSVSRDIVRPLFQSVLKSFVDVLVLKVIFLKCYKFSGNNSVEIKFLHYFNKSAKNLKEILFHLFHAVTVNQPN